MHASQTRARRGASRGSAAFAAVFVWGLTIGVSGARAATPDAVGGGYVASGIEGAYFPNAGLEGEPAFTRRDVRIDFDWGELSPIGGSLSQRYRSFPRDGFSVRWSGQLLPRFSQCAGRQ